MKNKNALYSIQSMFGYSIYSSSGKKLNVNDRLVVRHFGSECKFDHIPMRAYFYALLNCPKRR